MHLPLSLQPPPVPASPVQLASRGLPAASPQNQRGRRFSLRSGSKLAYSRVTCRSSRVGSRGSPGAAVAPLAPVPCEQPRRGHGEPRPHPELARNRGGGGEEGRPFLLSPQRGLVRAVEGAPRFHGVVVGKEPQSPLPSPPRPRRSPWHKGQVVRISRRALRTVPRLPLSDQERARLPRWGPRPCSLRPKGSAPRAPRPPAQHTPCPRPAGAQAAHPGQRQPCPPARSGPGARTPALPGREPRAVGVRAPPCPRGPAAELPRASAVPPPPPPPPHCADGETEAQSVAATGPRSPCVRGPEPRCATSPGWRRDPHRWEGARPAPLPARSPRLTSSLRAVHLEPPAPAVRVPRPETPATPARAGRPLGAAAAAAAPPPPSGLLGTEREGGAGGPRSCRPLGSPGP